MPSAFRKCLRHKDFVLYAIFMITFSLVSWMDRGDETGYYINTLMRADLLTTTWRVGGGKYTYKTFYDIANVGESWDYLEKVFLPFALQETYENGDPIPEDYRYYPHNSKLLGIRLRTVRVKPDMCDATGLSEYLSKPCYDKFGEKIESKESYGALKKFEWSDENSQLENSYWGKLNIYPGHGYFIDLPLNQSAALAVVQEARASEFIDDSTRAFFVDFQLYNEPTNLHIVCRTVIEYPSSGGARPKATFNVLKINNYNDPAGMLQMVLEFIIGGFAVYFLLEEIVEMKLLGFKAYRRSFWNVIDLINIIIFLFVGSMRIYFYTSLRDIDPIKEYPNYISLQLRVNAFAIESMLLSINAWLLWFKLLKFLSSNPKFGFLTDTFLKAAWELVFFSVIFLFLMIGFGHAGYVCFNSTSMQYRSFEIGFINTFLATTGGLDSAELAADNTIAGPLFVFLFELSMVVILVNVFLAIINSAYDEVNEEQRHHFHRGSNVDRVGIMVMDWFKTLRRCECCKKKDKGASVQPVEDKKEEDKKETEKPKKKPPKKPVLSAREQTFQDRLTELRALEKGINKLIKEVARSCESLES